MYVSDVTDAFLLIPLAPWIWPFFFFRWFEDDSDGADLFLYCHLFGDFGTRGLPATFKVFFVDVVVQMARSEFILTLPLEIYVDDGGLIGPRELETNVEMRMLQSWTSEYCGVEWKQPKDKPASQQNQMIGFIWNSNFPCRLTA